VIKLGCTAKSKQASIEWRKKGEVAPVKVKIHHSAGNVFSQQFFGTLKVFFYFLYERHTVVAVYYYQVLDKARLSYRSKRRGFPIRSVLLQEHNARPLTLALTRQKLEKMKWTTLNHPPYSTDLAPYDYYLLGPLKEKLGG